MSTSKGDTLILIDGAQMGLTPSVILPTIRTLKIKVLEDNNTRATLSRIHFPLFREEDLLFYPEVFGEHGVIPGARYISVGNKGCDNTQQ
jgi:hypothetical protein